MIPQPPGLAADLKEKFELLYEELLTPEQRWQSIADAIWREWNHALSRSDEEGNG